MKYSSEPLWGIAGDEGQAGGGSTQEQWFWLTNGMGSGKLAMPAMKSQEEWVATGRVGPKVSQAELGHLRNQYLSLVIFHLNVHYFSELCTRTALCLVITERYKQQHKENYSRKIWDLIMQTQDKVKILMKFLSILTFFKYNIAKPGFGREGSTQPTAEQSSQTLGQLASAICLIRRTQEIA